jgi:hypothetical protein
MVCKFTAKKEQFIFKFDDVKSNPNFNYDMYIFEPMVTDGDYVFKQKDLTNVLKARIAGNSSYKLLF